MCSHWISIGFPDYWRAKWNKCPRHSENPASVDRFPFGQSTTVHNEFNNQLDLLDWILCIGDTHTPTDSGFLCMYEYRPRNKSLPTGESFVVDPFLWQKHHSWKVIETKTRLFWGMEPSWTYQLLLSACGISQVRWVGCGQDVPRETRQWLASKPWYIGVANNHCWVSKSLKLHPSIPVVV